jgi:predicted DNA-binding transcriptional regulator YafY
MNQRQKAKTRRSLIPKLKLKGFNNTELAQLFEVNPSQITRDIDNLT